jgi:ElaA protein
MHWRIKCFKQLTTDELYQLLKLRSDIFVVEQECAYSDLDGLDRHVECHHLMGYGEFMHGAAEPALIAYARLFAPSVAYAGYSSIGRVLVNPQYRVKGLGHELMQCAIKNVFERWPNSSIKIGAQAHLDKFYGRHGFEIVGERYLEDGIPHVPMVLQPPR